MGLQAQPYAWLSPHETARPLPSAAPGVEAAQVTPVAEVFAAQPSAGLQRRTARYRRRLKLASFFGWVQFTGVLLFLFVAWQLWGTGIAQHHAQESLARQFNSHVKTPLAKSAAPTLVSADARLAEPPEGSVVARLQIPAIHVDEYVVEGTAEGDLGKGPGHYIGTAMPGQAGNVAIAGHRTTYGAPFYNLNNLIPGDVIILTTDSGVQLRYVESQDPVAVSPDDVSVLNSFGDNRLTLTTCNPKYSSTQRLVAVATLQTPMATPVATTASSTADKKTGNAQPEVSEALAQSSAGWHFIYLPEALLFLAILVLLGWLNVPAARYFGQTMRWVIMVPLWLAVIYLMFGALNDLLPAAL